MNKEERNLTIVCLLLHVYVLFGILYISLVFLELISVAMIVWTCIAKGYSLDCDATWSETHTKSHYTNLLFHLL